ncbi:hypothetical protein HYFRA_00013990 [Hymenoscyphus fraxineus]|uniref:Uncharacterized protein n=1 Tax=Hymenoscyphus fraxineus TaxID=746836 RepID=A0A9N9L995_9HELO|nr:hypothetical protein HYFRA_00013990 [Hymenoscyphus fraxineus]
MHLNFLHLATLFSAPALKTRNTPPLGPQYPWTLENWFGRLSLNFPASNVAGYAFNITGEEIQGDVRIPGFFARCERIVPMVPMDGTVIEPCTIFDIDRYPSGINRSVVSTLRAGKGTTNGDATLWISYRFTEFGGAGRVYNYSSSSPVEWPGVANRTVDTTDFFLEEGGAVSDGL